MLERLREDSALVPSLWPLEIANGLISAERRGRLSPAGVARAAELVLELPIAVQEVPPSLALGAVIDIARSQALSAYDAAYLELAVREGCRSRHGTITFAPLQTAWAFRWLSESRIGNNGAGALAEIGRAGILRDIHGGREQKLEIKYLPEAPAVFDLVKSAGPVDDEEMFRVYNMGVGFCVVCAPESADRVRLIAS